MFHLLTFSRFVHNKFGLDFNLLPKIEPDKCNCTVVHMFCRFWLLLASFGLLKCSVSFPEMFIVPALLSRLLVGLRRLMPSTDDRRRWRWLWSWGNARRSKQQWVVQLWQRCQQLSSLLRLQLVIFLVALLGGRYAHLVGGFFLHDWKYCSIPR